MVDTLVRPANVDILPRTQAATNKLPLSDPSFDLLNNYFRSKRSASFTGSISKALSSKPHDIALFYRMAAGSLFGELAYDFITSQHRGKHYVLSPDETFQVYASLYPLRIINQYNGISKGIRGISVPDGLIVHNSRRTLQIRGILEYKAGSSIDERVPNQIRNFTTPHLWGDSLIIESQQRRNDLGSILHAIKPELDDKPIQVHPKCDFSYAVPQDSRLHLPGNRIEIPIFPNHLREIATALFQDSQPNLTL